MTPDRATSTDSLDHSLFGGIAWMGIVRLLSQTLSWAVTILVARILSPRDYGIMGIATIYVGLLQLMNQFGLGSAIIQREELPGDKIKHLAGFSIAVGFAFFALSIVLAPLVARFFEEEVLRWVIIALSVNFIISSVKSIPRSLLARELRFKTLAWLDGLRSFVLSVTTLGFAVAGFRFWSLVIGFLLAQVVETVALAMNRKFEISLWPNFGRIASEVRFGWNIVVSNMAWYVYSRADFAVIGRVLGTASLGAYNLGFSLASIPADKLTALIGRVVPSIFARVQNDKGELRRYIRILTEGISMVAFPAAVGLALVTEEFVLGLLGDDWTPAIAPLRILALYGGLQAVFSLLPHILIATDHSHLKVRFGLFMAVVMPVLFILGAEHGTVGVAAVWLIAYPLLFLPYHHFTVLSIIQMPLLEYLRSLWPATSSSILMALSVVALRTMLPSEWSHLLRLCVLVATGAVTYSLALWLMHSERLSAARDLVRAVRGKGPTRANDRGKPQWPVG